MHHQKKNPPRRTGSTLARLVRGSRMQDDRSLSVTRFAGALLRPAGGEGGALAHRRCATRQAHARVRREGREGEVGGAATRFVGPPPPALSPPPAGRGEGKKTSFC